MQQNKLYQKLILKYGISPDNYNMMRNPTHIGKGLNQFCGDQINIYTIIKNNKIADMSFLGRSCAISTASCSLMIKHSKNRSLDEFKKLFLSFSNMFIPNKNQLVFNQDDAILKNLLYVKKYPSRVKCVTLPWNIMYNIIIK